MKRVLFIGEDINFHKDYQSLDPECDFIMVRASEVSRSEESDILIISDCEVQPLMLSGFIQDIKAKQTYYLISNSPKNTIIENKIALCKQHGIKPVPPKQSNSQIVQRILGIAGEKRGISNVCSLFGTHAQVGTTTVALNLAHQLAEKGDKAICVLGLNQFNPGTTFFAKYIGNTLDEVYTQIIDNRKNMNCYDLVNYMHYDQNWKFHYLAGNQDFSKRGFFQADVIEHIITVASDQFDIVLLDVGFSPCNNMTLQGLFKSEIKLLIGNQQPVSTEMWKQMNNDILKFLGITTDEFLLVVNRNKLELPIDLKSLQANMEVPVIGMIPDFGDEGLLCEMEKRLFCESRNKQIRKKAVATFNELGGVVSERVLGYKGGRMMKEKTGLWNKVLS